MSTVTAEFALRLVVPGSGALPVLTDLRYHPGDPYAVHVTFRTGSDDEVVEWTFARQLLTDGVARPVGDGDVQVWPAYADRAPVVCLALSSPAGRAVFEMPLGALAEFLTRTYTVVPTGCESDFVDLDAELAALLDDGLPS